eukprot:jgi/Psemu1/15412/gm1.15412_g
MPEQNAGECVERSFDSFFELWCHARGVPTVSPTEFLGIKDIYFSFGNLPNPIDSLFIAHKDDTKTLVGLDPVTILRKIIINEIMDCLPSKEKTETTKQCIAVLFNFSTMWHIAANGSLGCKEWWYPYKFMEIYDTSFTEEGEEEEAAATEDANVDTNVQVPSSYVSSPSSTTDLVTNKTIDSDAAATPSNSTARTSQYTWDWTYSPNSNSVFAKDSVAANATL